MSAKREALCDFRSSATTKRNFEGLIFPHLFVSLSNIFEVKSKKSILKGPGMAQMIPNTTQPSMWNFEAQGPREFAPCDF